MRRGLRSLHIGGPLLRFVVLALATVLALWLAFRATWPALSVVGRTAGDSPRAVALPWTSSRQGAHEANVTLLASRFTPSRWHIVVDDHLRSVTANGVLIPLDGVPARELQDYANGFDLELGSYLAPGRNDVVFRFDNWGGPGGFDLRPVRGTARSLFFGAAFLPFVVGLAGLFRLRRAQIAAVAASLLLLTCYWAKTPWDVRGHDVAQADGHLAYVLYVADHARLPDPKAGWTFYHPPLYYVAGAAVTRLARAMELPVTECLQALSIALWLVFVVASAGAIRLSRAGRRVAVVVATASLAFWPAGILHAVRIGNDLAFYAIAGVATWFIIRWWRGERPRDLVAVSACAGLALSCKANATVIAFVVAVLVAVRVVRARERSAKTWTRALRDLGILALGQALAVGLVALARLGSSSHHAGMAWLVGNATELDARLRVPVRFLELTTFDVVTFLREPWMNPWSDGTARDRFSNYLLRSALSGEFSFDGRIQRTIALLWGPLLLAALAVGAAMHVWRLRAARAREALIRQAPWIVVFVAFVAALWLLRVAVPYCCSNDFRYVVPVIVPTVLAIATSGWQGRALLFAIASLSTVFFVTL